MNRRSLGVLLASVAVAGGWGCGERQTAAPTQPEFAVTALSAFDDLQAQITALFPTGRTSLRNAAIKHLRNIERALAAGDLSLARNKMFTLVDYTLQKFNTGSLLDPNGANPPTTADAVCQLINGLYAYVSLTPPATCAGAVDEDGAAVVVGPEGGLVVTGNGHAGADIPPGAIGTPVLVTITRIPDPSDPTIGPLNTALDQYPRFYEVTTSPATALASDFVVGICVYDPPNPLAPPSDIAARLRVAHNVGEGIEILPLVAAPFLTCDDLSVRSGGPLNFASRVGQWVARLVGPRPLFAATTTMVNPGGVGGLAGGFSPFGAVDPGAGEDPPPPPPSGDVPD